MNFHCGMCKDGNVKPTKGTGRHLRYCAFTFIPVPDDFEILTCDSCGETYTSLKTEEDLHKFQTPIYFKYIKARMKNALDFILKAGYDTVTIEKSLRVARGSVKKWLKQKEPTIKEAELRLLEVYAEHPEILEKYKLQKTFKLDLEGRIIEENKG